MQDRMVDPSVYFRGYSPESIRMDPPYGLAEEMK